MNSKFEVILPLLLLAFGILAHADSNASLRGYTKDVVAVSPNRLDASTLKVNTLVKRVFKDDESVSFQSAPSAITKIEKLLFLGCSLAAIGFLVLLFAHSTIGASIFAIGVAISSIALTIHVGKLLTNLFINLRNWWLNRKGKKEQRNENENGYYDSGSPGPKKSGGDCGNCPKENKVDQTGERRNENLEQASFSFDALKNKDIDSADTLEFHCGNDDPPSLAEQDVLASGITGLEQPKAGGCCGATEFARPSLDTENRQSFSSLAKMGGIEPSSIQTDQINRVGWT